MSDAAVASPSPEDAPVMITVFLAPSPMNGSLCRRFACTFRVARGAVACATARSAPVLDTELRMLRRAAAGGTVGDAATRPVAGARVPRVEGRAAETTRVETEEMMDMV